MIESLDNVVMCIIDTYKEVSTQSMYVGPRYWHGKYRRTVGPMAVGSGSGRHTHTHTQGAVTPSSKAHKIVGNHSRTHIADPAREIAKHW